MVEEIVHTEIDHRILAEFLLQHEVPNAERLGLVALRACPCVLICEDIAALEVAVHLHIVRIARNRVAVEHMNVVVAPKGGTEPAAHVLIVDADVELVLRFVEQALRHVRIALVDRMEERIADLRRPMLVEFILDLELEPCDLCLPDILKAVEHIGRVPEFLSPRDIRVEIDVVPRVIGRHVVADRIVKEICPHRHVLRLGFVADIEVHRFLRFQIRITGPVPAETCTILIDGATAVHLPVVVELTHARL